MHDIKYIRQNSESFDAAMARRGLTGGIAKAIVFQDKHKREMEAVLQEAKRQKNELDKLIGQAKVKGEDITPFMEEAKRLNDGIEYQKDIIKRNENILLELEENLKKLPNIPADDVPQGKDEHDNKQVRAWGEKPAFAFASKLHDDLGVALGLMDFDGAAKMSGARFVVLKGALARMERALAGFFLDMHLAKGYTEMVTPALVREQAAFGTGNLPKFADQLFKTGEGFYLIPTAEMTLTNLVADSIVEESTLPMRMTAYSPCFRSEAGAAGKDTRGMIRQHQFSKVEMVSITTPEQSDAEHERMTGCAEAILQALKLPYRTMLLCSGDMGFSAQKTYDIEVWMPGQDAYREISSCSNCGAFQARRMKARFKRGKDNMFVHTLNGSGLPIGRTMVAIIENYQNADGSITVPEALRPYMGGLEVIK